MNTPFPNYTEKQEDNLSIRLFGKRIYGDQTFNEYLLEFLLVFCAAKQSNGDGKLLFHNEEQVSRGNLKYYIQPRNGLKRFIFYDKSKRDSRSDIDTQAYNEMLDMLERRSDSDDYPYMLQDMLYGYALVLKKRGWYAQSLLPVAPELIFPEALGINIRKSVSEESPIYVETAFQHSQHDFMARGGEMYYLHLLQGIYEHPEGMQFKAPIENGIRHMLCEKSKGFSVIANNLQTWWLEDQKIDSDDSRLTTTMSLGYTQPGFDRRSVYSLSELAIFLSSELHPITRIELMNYGMMLALLRTMHLQAFYTVNPNASSDPVWIIDMRSGNANSNIGKLAAKSFRDTYTVFGDSLNILYSTAVNSDESSRFSDVHKEFHNSADVFKKMAKEIQLVIPLKGNYERFTLTEQLARYLVLSFVRPRHKMTLDTFLEKLYEHYGMVIGPEQYRKSGSELGMTGYFEENKQQFQNFLKDCGLLHDLSDATSVVENPYSEVIYE